MNLVDRAVIRSTVERVPEGSARRVVLELGHDPTVEVSDEEDSDDPDEDAATVKGRAAMWPAHRAAVEA
eukprot:1731105-Alexandrium_andersonii.AAC.1